MLRSRNARKKETIRRGHGRWRWGRIGFLFLILCLIYKGICEIPSIWAGDAGGVANLLTKGRDAVEQSSSRFLLSGDYPDSLRKLAVNNPETIDFVKNYPEKKGVQEKIDVSGELTGGIPLFLQWDERWGYRQYGGDYMAVNGCGPTCLSMVWCGLNENGKWNPYKLAKKAEKEGYYVKGAGTSWELMSSGAEKLGLQVEKLSLNDSSILDHLGQGNPIICVVGPGDFTTQGHFLVLTGVDKNGEIIINDPNSPKRSKKRWELDRLMSQVRNLWAYHL